MKLLHEAYCPYNYFWSGNGQDIRETILRAATNNCKMYATDVICFFDHLKEFPETTSIWFRDMGVDWNHEPKEWNYKLILEVDGDHYNLYEEMKND